MFRQILLVILIIFMVGCNNNDNLDDYEKLVDEVLEQKKFDDEYPYDVEAIYVLNENIFYVIIDGNQDVLEDFKVVAVPVNNRKIVGYSPQQGYFDDAIDLGIDSKGIILSGEIDGDVDDFAIQMKVEYINNGNINVNYLMIENIVLIEK